MRIRNGEGDDCGEQPADEVYQSRADKIAYSLDVTHDARNQRAGLVGVVICNR